MNEWIELGEIEDIPCMGARILKTGNGNVAVFRTAEDEIFALEDKCPHKNGPLSQGIVHGRRVTCPLHNLVLELADGQAVPPDEGCVPLYSIKIENEKIFVKL
ncbi:MAG: nitrite reductase small subunit NirD [bacterium]|nr:nitrite reductase small subunit NirD [bacterium]